MEGKGREDKGRGSKGNDRTPREGSRVLPWELIYRTPGPSLFYQSESYKIPLNSYCLCIHLTFISYKRYVLFILLIFSLNIFIFRNSKIQEYYKVSNLKHNLHFFPSVHLSPPPSLLTPLSLISPSPPFISTPLRLRSLLLGYEGSLLSLITIQTLSGTLRRR